MAIYYGRYSNRNRGLRKKAAMRLARVQGQAVPPSEYALAPEPEDARRNASKANWAIRGKPLVPERSTIVDHSRWGRQ